eukprot:INCI15742.1.p1 GENE.INCI15742.1~~INCI15742.1.p1  ORF type:complete len:1137 (+),score=246.29 INCI15742.1:59-3469(+)
MKGSRRREKFLKAQAENRAMKANLRKTNFTLAENGSTDREMVSEHRREYYKKRVDWFEPGEIQAEFKFPDEDPAKSHDRNWPNEKIRQIRDYKDNTGRKIGAANERVKEKSMAVTGASIARKSNITLGQVPSEYKTTAGASFNNPNKDHANNQELRYKLDMSKVRNSSIPIQDADQQMQYQSTAAAEYTKKSVDQATVAQKEGGSQKTNFTMGFHKTDYSTVSKMPAPEPGVSYRHANRGAAANRQASWKTGSDAGTWETESGQSNKHAKEPVSLLESKPDFVEQEKQRALAKASQDKRVHNPGHVSSVYIGVASGKGSWDTEAGGEYTKKNNTAAEAARDREQVARMKHNVRKSNLQLTDNTATAYESTSKAQLFNPDRDGAVYDQRSVIDKAALNRTNFHMGSETTDYKTTANQDSGSRTEVLMAAAKARAAEKGQRQATRLQNTRTNIHVAEGSIASNSSAKDDFRAPARDAYRRSIIDNSDKTKSSVHLGVQKVSYERDGKDALEQELYRVDKYKLGTNNDTAQNLRKTNFSLGQSDTDYTSEGNRAYQKMDQEHYRSQGTAHNKDSHKTNFTLGFQAVDYATTSASDAVSQAPGVYAQQRTEIKAMKSNLAKSNFSIGEKGEKAQYKTENEARSERIAEGRPGALDPGMVKSLRASNFKLGSEAASYDTTAGQDFTKQKNQNLRYELDMSKVRNSSIPIQDADQQMQYQSTAAAEYTKKSVDQATVAQKEGGSQKTNFTMGFHKTDYSTVSKMPAPEPGVSYRHANRGAAANRQASWKTGSDAGTWETESGQSNKHAKEPVSLLESKPDFVEQEKQRALAKASQDKRVHNPGHVSSVYIGVASGKGSWDTEAGGEYTKKNNTAAEAARDREQVARMKHNVRKSNLQLTDNTATAYESTSKAQLFNPDRDGAPVNARASLVVAANKTNFSLGVAKASYGTTSGGDRSSTATGSDARTQELLRATKARVKEQAAINQGNRAKMKTNVYLAGDGADVDPWRTNAVSSFAPPPPESYIADKAAAVSPSDDAYLRRASMEHEKLIDEKPDMSEFWKDHRPKQAQVNMRRANFSLGQDAIDYTSHAHNEFANHGSEHYKNAGTTKVPALRASNFTLGHDQTKWQSTTHAAHRDEDED